jgi:hypothetical protein
MPDFRPATDPPFAVWTLFRGLPRWFLARGCPPPLRDDRRWARGLRTSVLLGLMGLASSWASVFWLLIERWLFDVGMLGTILFTPGLWFGLIVLLPLSRWVGRGWLASVLSVPASMAAYYTALLQMRPPGSLAGAWGGFGVGLWLMNPRRPSTWWVAPLAAVAGWLPYVILDQLPDPWNPATGLPALDRLQELIGQNLLFSPFQVLVAMALGVRLWWPPPEETTAA